ncbi:MAG: FKBP-type peptidyl-prolyl cis-trans isomerase [Paludibacter sp.]|nr:FKBP-type peptidyl-prolyl cis-trans isomerase [Paludibacter sp.]MDD4428509.1 FKBP-type peptidyl-prolyl cis-trans isomerase [Paludibacter sp.]
MRFQLKHIFILLISVLFLSSCDEDKYGDWKTLNENWLEKFKNENKDDPDFFVTESGLCYRMIHEGYYAKPNIESVIYVKYSGKLITGESFENKTIYLRLSTMSKGWKEGLPKIREGGRLILYIPAKLGYGDDGSGAIPPYSTLIFDIELKDVINNW